MSALQQSYRDISTSINRTDSSTSSHSSQSSATKMALHNEAIARTTNIFTRPWPAEKITNIIFDGSNKQLRCLFAKETYRGQRFTEILHRKPYLDNKSEINQAAPPAFKIFWPCLPNLLSSLQSITKRLLKPLIMYQTCILQYLFRRLLNVPPLKD